METLFEKYKNHKKIIGTLTHIKSAAAIEALGYTGVDFVMFDMEHSPLSINELSSYITASSAANISSIVRVSEGKREHILHALDIGADAVIVPSITNAQQVKEIIKYAKFSPIGERGYCMSRSGGWGFAPQSCNGLKNYMAHCNQNTMLIPQCETVGCVDNIYEITSLNGVDGILIGPYDLSIDMGIAGEFDNPKFITAINKIIDACKKNNKMLINFAGDTDTAIKYFNDGFDAILFGIDIIMYINNYKNALNVIKENI